MLLASPQEVAPTLASFYALGAKRNGWLFHRSLEGEADADRTALSAAGLDVAGLEAAGRMVFSEISIGITVEDYVHAWEPEFEGALARGFDAVWWARFPIGPDAEIIDRSVEYDAAWDAHFHGRPCVSLCLFIVRDVERGARRDQVAVNHDAVVG
ncbi:MEDS domain-containing protein [Solirubrobacter phytolaccae]|nr:MEDS domain-containing protein [Solirubrobacter phytolaccae]